MKRVEELGISQIPWSVSTDRQPNGEALRDAVIDACHGCRYEEDGKCTNVDRDCHVQKWRAVLAEASGEVSNG